MKAYELIRELANCDPNFEIEFIVSGEYDGGNFSVNLKNENLTYDDLKEENKYATVCIGLKF